MARPRPENFIGSCIQMYHNSHIIHQDMIQKFAEQSGDFNKIHVDPEYAAKTIFGRTVAHGVLLLSLVSADVVKHFGQDKRTPILVHMQFNFLHPVFAEDEIDIHFHGRIHEGKNKKWLVSINETKNNKLCVDGFVLIR